MIVGSSARMRRNAGVRPELAMPQSDGSRIPSGIVREYRMEPKDSLRPIGQVFFTHVLAIMAGKFPSQ